MNKKVVGVVCIASTLFALNGSALTFADDPVDLSVTVGEVLSLSIPNQPQNISITPTAAGYYDSTGFNVTSATNSPAGYTLSMSASNTDLTSNIVNVITGEPPVIPTLTASQEGISAEAFAASTDTNILNHYGVSIAGGNFNAMPSQTTAVKVTDENNSSSADVTSIALAAKLDLNTVPGTYSTTINFTIVINSVDPVQPYPPDPCDADVNCDSTSGTTIQRAYEIAYTNAHKGMYEEDAAGSGTFHWVDSWGGVSYEGGGRDVRFAMQDMTPEICNTATVVGSTALVLDIRDQTSYRIVKAADGRCWMQDNLALDLTDSTVLGNLSNTNTNADIASLISLRSGNRANGSQYAIAGITTYTAEEIEHLNNWEMSEADLPLYSIPLIYAAIKNDSNSSDGIVSVQSSKYGVYYNYCAASAGSYCYGNGTDEGEPLNRPNTALDVEYDICPTGWRIPTGNSYDATDRPDGGENQAIFDAYSNLATFRSALLIPFSGAYVFWTGSAGDIWYEGELYGQGSQLDFWSSTRADGDGWWENARMYVLYATTSSGFSQERFTRDSGYTIRCINKTGTEPAPSSN